MGRRAATDREVKMRVEKRVQPKVRRGARKREPSPRVNYQLLRAIERSEAVRAELVQELCGKELPDVVEMIREGRE